MEQGRTGSVGDGGTSPSGWFPDPLGRYDHRWFNGTSWTADVSVDGQRYVDPLPLSGPFPARQQPPGWASWAPAPGTPAPPSRTMAVLSFVFGLLSVFTGWMPLAFVVGAAAGVAGLVLGVVARRRVRAGVASGGGLATAGLVLSPIGLALCAVGVMLTAAVFREVTAFLEPGPVDASITSCALDGTGVAIEGTVENLDDEVHDYVVVVEVVDADDDVLERQSIEVGAVAAGEVRSWETLVFVRGDVPDPPSCDIREVNGPFPWGIDPEGS